MRIENEKRYNAKALIITPVENPRRGEKDQGDIILTLKEYEFENVQTPAANNIGFMIFQGPDWSKHFPVNDVKRVELTELKVQGVVPSLSLR